MILKEKVNFGKKSIGIVRSTFLIGKDHNINKVWLNVKASDHGQKVLQALKL